MSPEEKDCQKLIEGKLYYASKDFGLLHFKSDDKFKEFYNEEACLGRREDLPHIETIKEGSFVLFLNELEHEVPLLGPIYKFLVGSKIFYTGFRISDDLHLVIAEMHEGE